MVILSNIPILVANGDRYLVVYKSITNSTDKLNLKAYCSNHKLNHQTVPFILSSCYRNGTVFRGGIQLLIKHNRFMSSILQYDYVNVPNRDLYVCF